MRFHRPAVDVALAPGLELGGGDGEVEIARHRVRILAHRLHHHRVPVVVQVRPGAAAAEIDAVAALVVIVGKVQRLVQVAGEVQHELEGEDPVRRRRVLRRQLRREQGEPAGQAVIIGAGGVRRVGAVDLDVGEVPGRRLAMAVAPHVRPGGAGGHVRGRQRIRSIRRQEGVDGAQGLRGQVLARDLGDDRVALLAPGEGGRRGGGDHQRHGDIKGRNRPPRRVCPMVHDALPPDRSGGEPLLHIECGADSRFWRGGPTPPSCRWRRPVAWPACGRARAGRPAPPAGCGNTRSCPREAWRSG